MHPWWIKVLFSIIIIVIIYILLTSNFYLNHCFVLVWTQKLDFQNLNKATKTTQKNSPKYRTEIASQGQRDTK